MVMQEKLYRKQGLSSPPIRSVMRATYFSVLTARKQLYDTTTLLFSSISFWNRNEKESVYTDIADRARLINNQLYVPKRTLIGLDEIQPIMLQNFASPLMSLRSNFIYNTSFCVIPQSRIFYSNTS